MWDELKVRTPYDVYVWKRKDLPPDRLCKACGFPTQEFVLKENGQEKTIGWKCVWCGELIRHGEDLAQKR